MTTATPTRPDFREQQADDAPKWWRDLSSFEQDILLIATVVIIIGVVIYGLGDAFALVVDFAPNVITEILFFAATVVIIDRRNRQRSENERKEELILQMGSPHNEFAVEAVRLLGHYKSLYDGTLQGRVFVGADLHRVNLMEANLQDTWFMEANLKEAEFHHAKLQKANMSNADLQGAVLWQANLKGTTLIKTKFQGARLRETNLRGAYLLNAEFDEETTLPDNPKWSPDVDMRKFTDPDHPEFWQPEWVKE